MCTGLGAPHDIARLKPLFLYHVMWKDANLIGTWPCDSNDKMEGLQSRQYWTFDVSAGSTGTTTTTARLNPFPVIFRGQRVVCHGDSIMLGTAQQGYHW